MLKSVEVKDYMLTHPVTVHEDADMGEAIRLIITNKISGLCVVDENKRLVGILSELDCMRAMLRASRDNLVVAAPGEDITDVAQDMLRRKMRRRPVVKDGQLIGQITCRQLLKAVKNFAG